MPEISGLNGWGWKSEVTGALRGHSGLTAPATMEMVRLRLLFSTLTAWGEQADRSCPKSDRLEQLRPLDSTEGLKPRGRAGEGMGSEGQT